MRNVSQTSVFCLLPTLILAAFSNAPFQLSHPILTALSTHPRITNSCIEVILKLSMFILAQVSCILMLYLKLPQAPHLASQWLDVCSRAPPHSWLLPLLQL